MPERNNLPRDCRLTRQSEIQTLFKAGERIQTPFFSLLWLAGDRFLFGVFVGRKHGSAVVRNRIKRLFREAVRLNKKELSVTGMVGILPTNQAKETDFQKIHDEVSRIFRELSSR